MALATSVHHAWRGWRRASCVVWIISARRTVRDRRQGSCVAVVPRGTRTQLRACRSDHSRSLWHHSTISTAHCGRVYAPMAACSFSCRYSRMGDGWHETGLPDTIGASLCLIRMIIMYVPRTYVRDLAGKMLRLIAVQESVDRATH